jgi:serine phosphatase RsbU (regulator of sigma subunit)
VTSNPADLKAASHIVLPGVGAFADCRNGLARLDGMEIALCSYNKDNNTIQFSGANRPLVLRRNNEAIVYKLNKFPIGQDIGIEKDFTGKTIQLQKDDAVYIFTDGIVDQFGGKKNKKLRKLIRIYMSIYC